MSYPIMPPMPISMASGLKKSPNYNTVKQKTVAGSTSAFALKPFPSWDFEFSLDHVIGREWYARSIVAQFLGVFMATAGGAGLFLFTDPQDCSCTGAQFGIGDGSAVVFQLSRNIFGQPDIIQNLNGAAQVYVSDVLTAVTISSTGVVTFPAAPANGAVLTWTGSFYFLCRFSEDTIDATREFTVNNGLDHWSFSGIKFSSEFATSQTFGKIAAPGGA